MTSVSSGLICLNILSIWLKLFGSRTAILAGLPGEPLRPEFGLMGELASQQVRDILDALIEQNPDGATLALAN